METTLTDEEQTIAVGAAEHLKRVRIDFSDATSDEAARLFERFPLWLNDYNIWLINALELTHEQNLHRAYGRHVDFNLPPLPEFATETKECLKAVFAVGWSSSITMQLSQLVKAFDVLQGYLDDRLVGAITVVAKDDVSSHANAPCTQLDGFRNVLKSLRERGTSLTLVGSLAQWEPITLGIHNDAASLTIATASPAAARRRNCHGFTQCFVRKDGLIFPCIALRGVDLAAMGTIFEPASHISSPLLPQIAQWAKDGPSVAAHLSPSERTNGGMCKLHAEEIVRLRHHA